jgi:cytochrome b6-f complex iron-sulfur subunit
MVAPGRPPGQQPLVSRRRILQIGFWSSLGAIIAGTVVGGLDMVYPSSVTGFGGKVTLKTSDVPPPGEKLEVREGRFWLANLTQEQGGPGLLALWWKCPHLGCTVPWKPAFVWPDPTTGADKQGWFRCPCHGSTFTDTGILVFGPSSRPMDTMEVVEEDGSVTVDTGKIAPGGPDNPDRALRV